MIQIIKLIIKTNNKDQKMNKMKTNNLTYLSLEIKLDNKEEVIIKQQFEMLNKKSKGSFYNYSTI